MNATFYYNDNRVLDYHDGSQNIVRIVWENGCEEYYENGVLHRDGGLPALIHANGSKEYFIYGKRRTREFGPSIEWATGEVVYEDEGDGQEEPTP
jgi:hypothetical protein